jgi:glycine/D-amino acid oxidase-like deaminating enzyme
MKIYDVAIVGAGIMGACAAYEAAQRGAKVALIDQASLPNPQGASVDYSKIFRFAYPEPIYVRMAVEALPLWRKLEAATTTRLLDEAGLLMLGSREGAFETQTYEVLRALDLKAELLKSEEVAGRFPQFNKEAFSFAAFDPSGGILYADKAVQAAIHLAQKFGAEVFENQRVTAIEQNIAKQTLLRGALGEEWICGKVLLASGPWTRKLLPELAGRLTTTRQEVVYFEPVNKQTFADASRRQNNWQGKDDAMCAEKNQLQQAQTNFHIGAFPIFIEIDSGFYGFPIHHAGAIKVGNHDKGEALDPYAFDEKVGRDFIERCRQFFARMIPELADARVTKSHVCIYNNSPDDDFIIDWHPHFASVLLATGFSGHGFKFGTIVGRIAAELLLEGKSNYPIERFSLSRFEK